MRAMRCEKERKNCLTFDFFFATRKSSIVRVERLDHFAAQLDLLEQRHELVVGAFLDHLYTRAERLHNALVCH